MSYHDKSRTEGGMSFRLRQQPFKGSIGAKSTIDKMYSIKVEYITINRYPPPGEIRESQQVRNLAPTDYHLFCSLQNFLNGKTFNSEEQITQAVENFFQSKPATFYKEEIYKLPEREEKVIDNSGEYVIN
ncbi:uncharacterized protein TNCV_94151 [Trichonephila clavipes]|nr:uncharacterized protein TNCV_94151 [Trichonephila clavipes]